MTRARSIPETISVHVPFRLVRRGGRKEMVLPVGTANHRSRIDSTLIKAVGRAFRWMHMLESGQFETIAELAHSEKIAPSYVTRVLRLTLLAPEIVEAILDGQQAQQVTLTALMEPFPAEWERQKEMQAHCSIQMQRTSS